MVEGKEKKKFKEGLAKQATLTQKKDKKKREEAKNLKLADDNLADDEGENQKEQPEQELADNGNVVHRKRRRRNVESKDAWTQTDRSDLMIIKQKQSEKKR